MRIKYEYTSYKHSKRATDLSHLASLFTVFAAPLFLVSLIMTIVEIGEVVRGSSWGEELTKSIVWTVVSAAFLVLRFTKIKAYIEKVAREDWEKYRKGIK